MPLTDDTIVAEFMRAGALAREGRFAEAAALWREILATAPQSAEARANFAGVLAELGELDAAVAEARAAVALKPEAAWAHYHLGRTLHLGRRWADAEAPYRQALALDPTDAKAQLALSHLLLTVGDFARGWPLLEARKSLPEQNAHPLGRPGEWRGEPLAGRSVLILPEQGFGDQIQFARYAPVLAAMGADVTLAAPPNLAPLFDGLGVRLWPQTPGTEPPKADFWTLPLSIPGRLATIDIPPAPYLAVPPERREHWRGFAPPRIEGRGCIGVAWQGRATYAADRHRSLPSPDLLAPFADAGARLVDLTHGPGDFADLAAQVEQMDLIVTVDTALGHVAGALGKPCFLILPWFRCDWRWGAHGETTPWYPAHRLFRQPDFGDWQSPIAAAAQAWRDQFRS